MKRKANDERIDREISRSIKRQISKSSLWFIRLRWGAIVGIAVGGITLRFLSYPIDLPRFFAIAIGLALINTLFHGLNSRFTHSDVRSDHLRRFNTMQIATDWLAVTLLIHLTGGILSPCIFFFFFHLVIAAILLPARTIYPLALLSVFLLSGLAVLEASGLIPLHPLSPNSSLSLHSDPMTICAILTSFAISAFTLVGVTHWVSNLIRQRMYQLSTTKVRLEDTSERLEAIFHIIRSIGEHGALDDLLDSALKQATGLWGIRAGFVLLKNPEKESYFFAAFHGLDTPPPEDSSLLELKEVASALERQDQFVVDDLRLLTGFEDCQSLQWLDAGGKRSMLLVPLRVGGRTFGAFCLTSQYPKRFEKEGKYFRIFGDLVAVDIQNTMTNQQLMEQVRTRTWFYRRAAHDLRAPLSAVRSMLATIRDGYAHNAFQINTLMGRADGRLEELQEMVDELLLLAEDRMDRLQGEAEPVNLGEILDAVLEIHRLEAETRKIHLECLQPLEAVLVRATRDGLKRIVANMISNAIKYNHDNGKVSIVLKKESDHAELTIADTGIGIPENIRENIFHEFYRAPNAKSHTSKGTGLGLAIVKKMVEGFHGRIQFTKNEENGTTFVIQFPVVTSSETENL